MKEYWVTIFILFSVLFSFGIQAQHYDQRCKLTDSIFVDNCVLETGAVRPVFNCTFPSHEQYSEETILLFDSLAVFLNNNPTIIFQIETHTDSRGSTEANMILSENRATDIKRSLVKRGIDSLMINTIGYGESQPSFVYLTEGKYYPYFGDLPENSKIVELTEKYINQYKGTNKALLDQLHQYNRRIIFRVLLKEK